MISQIETKPIMVHRITLLDLGGVVFQASGKSNRKIKWETINKLNNIYGHDLNIGKDRFADFMSEYNDLTNQKLSGNEFLSSLFDTLEINTKLIEMLGKKSDIVIVSDNYKENIEYISKRYHFKNWAVKQIYSYEYKLEKSNPMFFERLLSDLPEINKNDILFIDDSPSKIRSAQSCGIQAILFENNHQIEIALKELGI